MSFVIHELESNVRFYSRAFPATFTRATGPFLYDKTGRRYIDFFSGAGTLNYGHNHPGLKEALIEYIRGDGIAHSLDMATEARGRFLDAFDEIILRPRQLDYRIMFTGPTGTNAVEAALKVARKVTRRSVVAAFTNGFHGMSLGSLAVTGSASKRAGAGVPLSHAVHLPFEGYAGAGVDTMCHIEKLLDDASSGVGPVAAFIVETVQAEGGINVATTSWLRALERLARRHGALLIIDDIQIGCGRTGTFFSFEEAGIRPDIVCLSKALSGFGLPLSIVLIRPELDVWSPGEHNGTFRGNNHAMVTAHAALEAYWRTDELTSSVARLAATVNKRLLQMAAPLGARVRGRGLIQGIELDDAMSEEVSAMAFSRGLIIETSGGHNQVLKLLPPLMIESGVLAEGLDLLEASIAEVSALRPRKHSRRADDEAR